MRKSILTIFISLINILLCNAQQIGEWTTHTPCMTVKNVDIMHDKIFAATPYDVFYYNTIDNSINRLTRVNGLSDFGVSILRHSQTSDIIFVGYNNTNIDIIDNQGNITNIPDILNKNILGNKTINNVYFHERYAYVCCGFGIVVLDLKRNEVKDTYIIGDNGSYLNINDLTIFDGKYYAATSNGVYYADVNSTNLADFSQWTNDMTMIYPSRNYSQIETFNNQLIANYSDNSNDTDTLYSFNGSKWDYFNDNQHNIISDLRATNDRIIITEKYQNIKIIDSAGDIITEFQGYQPLAATFDAARGCYWLGTNASSLVKVLPNGDKDYIVPSGPYSNKVFNLYAYENDLWVASGGYTSTWAPTWNHDGLFHYDGNNWSFINGWNNAAFDTVTDVTCVRVNPSKPNIIYAGTYSKGLLVIENNKIKNIYDYTNSSLGKHLLIDFTFITDMDYDSNNNLWIANSGTDNMLSVMKTDGSWKSYYIGTGGVDISRMMVDKNDNKWILHREGIITLFNGNHKTISNSNGKGNLPGSANCFATDNNGTVWVGTNDGIGLFYNSNNILNSSTYNCSQILIPRNDGSGQADYLLSGEEVLCIAVDGGNNIWFGTNNGALHTTNDGQTTLHHFTTENSPLLSNTVKNITIDSDGNVYFATDKGIISYKGTASKGGDTNSNVIVYPNPVRPEYKGAVGIKGLVNNALVKITTTNGDFVTHLRAEGGQAIWDCNDINGRKVEPGIYLIFVSDSTGKETFATKVLIMR